MAKKCGIALLAIILTVGCGLAYMAYRSSSRADDDAWVKSASEMRINGYEKKLSGEGLKAALGQFNINSSSDALLLQGSSGTLRIGGRDHDFEILDEKAVGGAQILYVERGHRVISLVGPRNASSLEDLVSTSLTK